MKVHFNKKSFKGKKRSKHEKQKKKRLTTYLKVVKVAKRIFLEIYHKPEQTQQQHRQKKFKNAFGGVLEYCSE
jgi:hypothetical protein